MFWIYLGGIILCYCAAVRIRLGKLRSLRLVLGAGLAFFVLGTLILSFPKILFVWILQLIAVIGLCILSGIEVHILSGALKGRANGHSGQQSDIYATVVLGCGLKGGYRISTTMIERLSLAKDLWQGEPIIFSGGKTPHETIEEASVMKQWMEKNGIPANFLVLENKSRNSYENLTFSKTLLQNLPKEKFPAATKKSIRIITSDFHCGRIEKLALECGYTNPIVCGSNTMMLIAPVYHFRECLSITKHFLYKFKKSRKENTP